MLILVAVTVNVAMNGGLFNQAQTARTKTDMAADREKLDSAVVAVYDAVTKIVDGDALVTELGDDWRVTPGNNLWIVTSKNENIFTVTSDGKITSNDSNTERTPLEKYFIGKSMLDEWGNSEGISESDINYLVSGNVDGKEYMYIKYNNVVYKVTYIEQETDGSEIEFIAQSVEEVYTPTGREGQNLGTVMGDNNYNDWIILYDNGTTVEAVSLKAMGYLILGYDDSKADVRSGNKDENGNGTANEDIDKAIYSYNNAIERINNYCKTLTLPTNIGVRSVGAATDSTDMKYKISEEKTSKAYNEIGKIEDTAYEQDLVRMSCWGISKANKNYWMASRYVRETLGRVEFCIRYVPEGTLHRTIFFYAYKGNANGYTPSFAVRPVITINLPQS